MRYLGIEPVKPRVGIFDFSGCEGCQLQLLNKEESLGAFLSALEIVHFREGSSEASDDYDIAFIDGCVTREDEVVRLKKIRSIAKLVVAMGSCASFGGVLRHRNYIDLDAANREVYGDKPKETGKTRAIHEVVKVDVTIPGCPVSKTQVERIVQHLVLGVPFHDVVYPVCVECKQKFNTCMFEKGTLCLGPITRGGCGAPCPTGGLGCWGCRGATVDPNLKEFKDLALKRGFSEAEIDERLAFFGGFEGITCASI
ncbi:MAG: NADH:ubiquinone oxidoreductase [Deltaproteobacteria bacterium]|nr:NADH:ubiquinone oxidoreductase [Deltaproteobacteria bacterium]